MEVPQALWTLIPVLFHSQVELLELPLLHRVNFVSSSSSVLPLTEPDTVINPATHSGWVTMVRPSLPQARETLCPWPPLAHLLLQSPASLAVLCPICSSFWRLSCLVDAFCMLVIAGRIQATALPSTGRTSCPSLDRDSSQSPSLLIHRLVWCSSTTLHVSTVLQTTVTSGDALSQPTLPDVPSLQLDTASRLGPEQHWPWQNHYL